LVVGHALTSKEYKVRWDDEQYGDSDRLIHNDIKKVVKSRKGEQIDQLAENKERETLNNIIGTIDSAYRTSIHAENYKEIIGKAKLLLKEKTSFIITYIEKNHNL
jgi:hypothetical protein